MAKLLQLGRNTLILLMLLSAVGPLAVLQVVAWGGMLWDYSRDQGVAEAVEATFNGQNPCNLCLTIQQIEKGQETGDTGIPYARGALLLPLQWEEFHVLRPQGDAVAVYENVFTGEIWVMEITPPPPRQEIS